MKVNNVQELDDKTITFTGTLSAPEVEIVLSFGINALMSLGLMHLLPSVQVNEHQASVLN